MKQLFIDKCRSYGSVAKHLLQNLGAYTYKQYQQKSCETQLVQLVHNIIGNLDRAVNRGHEQIYLIIMDFATSFDKVPHRRLLHKLDNYGI